MLAFTVFIPFLDCHVDVDNVQLREVLHLYGVQRYIRVIIIINRQTVTLAKLEKTDEKTGHIVTDRKTEKALDEAGRENDDNRQTMTKTERLSITEKTDRQTVEK